MRTIITTLAAAALGCALYDLRRQVIRAHGYGDTLLQTLMSVHDLESIENDDAGIYIYTKEYYEKSLQEEFKEQIDNLPTAEGHDE